MIDKGVQVSDKRDAGKCSADAAQLVTVTITKNRIYLFLSTNLSLFNNNSPILIYQQVRSKVVQK